MEENKKFAFTPKAVRVIGMKEETFTIIWLKSYYISQGNPLGYESLNGDKYEDIDNYIYPRQNEFTFFSLIKISIFCLFIFFLYIILEEWFYKIMSLL